jgi:DNA processing protein
MACPECHRRATLIAALAPAISSLSFNRQSLLALLALPDEQLLHATKVKDPRELSRRLRPAPPTDRVPTALCRHDPLYPFALAQLPSAPAVLHATCTTERLRELLAAPTFAIVGSRALSSYAQQLTLALAHDLAAAGATVVSGLSNGLEGTALHGALGAEGHTIAVTSAGPEYPYPAHNTHLHQSICRRGAAVSELPPGFSPPLRWCFIARQRITAALAPVIVVVAAPQRSIALLAAQIAAELGHEVAVVPGRVTDAEGVGTFALLRDGAHPVACAQDVLELIGMAIDHPTGHGTQIPA